MRSGRLALLAAISAAMALDWAPDARAQVIPHAQDRPPGPALSPQEAIARMVVPPGFRVELVASEPDIVNPVAMTFDEKGRAWITESLEYPRKSAGPGRDRIKVLEDTDGDGKADRFTVFADGLNIPSGIAVGHGGVWVANAPDILFLRDTDGDGTADTREVVVTGFGRDDTHELPNSLTWGPDGWLYGWNGVFNPAHIDHRGKKHDFTCAIFRIHPRTRDFEVWSEGTSNPWGIAFNAEGDAFASACVIDHFWHLTESGYYHRQGGPYPPFTWKLGSIVDFKHQKAAYCGVHYFDSPAYPAQYRDKFYMGNIHGNCINVDTVVRSGATYKAIKQDDFLTANDAWFMPVVQKTGPDGSLYILDWYDRYHCYQDANRDPAGIDRLKGRLYRIRYGETPRRVGFDLAKESDEALIGRLGSPNVYDRDTAQRLLSERGDKVDYARLRVLVMDDGAPRKARLHGLWALIGAGPVASGILEATLADQDPVIRAWAVRAAGNLRTSDPAIRSAVVGRASDPDPSVRLQVAIAIRKIDWSDPVPVLVAVLSRAGDDAITAPIVWQNLHPMLGQDAHVRAFVEATEDATRSGGVFRIYPRVIDRLLARDPVDARPVAVLLGRLLDGPQADGEAAASVIAAIAAKLQAGEIAGAKSDALREALGPILGKLLGGDPDGPTARDAVLLAATWKQPAGLDAARKGLASRSWPEAHRLRALAALVAAGDPSTLDTAAGLLADAGSGSTDFRAKVLESLGRLDDPRVASVVLAAYPSMDPGTRPKAVELLTQRSAWALALVEAVAARKVGAEAVNANQIRKLQATRDLDLARLVRATFGTVREGRDPGRDRVIARMRAMVKDPSGDPSAGRAAFARVCAQCHKIYGEGQEVGPDLTANGRNDFEQLLSNVFDPSLVIGASYQATTVATADGRVLTGLLAEDGPQRVVLKLQGGKVETIARGDVEEIKVSPLSLMPEDVEKQLTDREWVDLFAFLTLDKPPGDPAARRLPGSVGPAPRPAAQGPR